MFCDAHCHPFDLLDYLGKDELDCMRRVHTPFLQGGVVDSLRGETACAASAWNRRQFEFHESLKKSAVSRGGAPVFLCFAVHPQLPARAVSPGFFHEGEPEDAQDPGNPDNSWNPLDSLRYVNDVLLPLLENLAREKRLDAVGETGFDLYDTEFKETEQIQDEIFTHHLEIALKYGLPLVLHVRRAMNKVFFHTKSLRKLPAVIFHSWPGTPGEGEAMLRRGINAFFSFGAAIVNNHKEARRSCAQFPAERLLLETDAPYAPPRGRGFSSWADLPLICRAAGELRKEGPEELEALTKANFFRAFRA